MDAFNTANTITGISKVGSTSQNLMSIHLDLDFRLDLTLTVHRVRQVTTELTTTD